jgi:hypothetical protein
MIQEGAVLQITPTASTSGRYVVLDVHSRVSQVREREIERGAEPNPIAALPIPAIDRPLLMNQRLSTTLRIPVGQPALVGGMTFESEPGPGEPNLYLFVEATVQELKDTSEAVEGEAQQE